MRDVALLSYEVYNFGFGPTTIQMSLRTNDKHTYCLNITSSSVTGTVQLFDPLSTLRLQNQLRGMLQTFLHLSARLMNLLKTCSRRRRRRLSRNRKVRRMKRKVRRMSLSGERKVFALLD